MSVESMTTKRQETELIVRLKLAQTNSAIAGDIRRASRPPRNGGEGKKRKRVKERGRKSFRRHASAGVTAGIGGRYCNRLGGGEGRRSEMTETTTVEMTEEETERDGDEKSNGEDDDDDENTWLEVVH